MVFGADWFVMVPLLPYTGTVADRADRQKIMMAANLAALVSIGAVAVAKAFYSPAAQAALPNVLALADLAAGNVVAGSAWGTMTVVGASLGGMLSAAAGPYVSFWAAAAGGLAVAVGLAARIRRPLQAPRDPELAAPRTWPAIHEALRYIAHRPRVLALVTVKSAVGLGNGVRLATRRFSLTDPVPVPEAEPARTS